MFKVVLYSFLLAFPFSSLAAPVEHYFIDHSITSSFLPSRVLLLVETSDEEVAQYSATTIRLNDRSNIGAAEHRLRVAGAVPKSRLGVSSSKIHFCFLLLGDGGDFAATPVRAWSREQLLDNSISIPEVLAEAEGFLNQIRIRKLESEGVEEKLKGLRERASEIAGVEEIVSLKMKIASLDNYSKVHSAELARLKELVEQGRSLPEPREAYELVGKLSEQLTKTAQATALADRLQSRRQQSAKKSLEQRLKLIEEMETLDAQSLAREALFLRKRRRELERRLGSGIADDDQF